MSEQQGREAPNPTPGSRGRRRRVALVLTAAVVLAAALGAWLASRPVEIDSLVPPRGPLERTLRFTARVETPARVDIGATLTGRVLRVPVREGERFAAGAPLVELESEELRATAAQADANLAQARARWKAQQAVLRPAAQAALAQAQANLVAAQRELDRARELVAQGFVSQARIDDAVRALAVARSQRDAAQVQAQANLAGGPEAATARAQLDAAAATAEAAAARLAQATLRAPASGRVLVRRVEPGQIVQPGAPLLTVAIDGPLELVAPVDERFLATLSVGQPARVVADAFPNEPFAASVTRLAPSIDAQRGAVEVHLRPDTQPPAFLREDMTLSVEVITGRRADARLLPLRAVRAAGGNVQAQRGDARDDVRTPKGAAGDDGESSGTVVVVEDGRAALRTVRLGLRTLDQVELVAGLADGEAVLLDPTLEPGTRVTPRLVDLQQALGAPAGTLSRDSVAPAMNAAGR
jgi:HlyD family secretion protein